MLTLSIIPPIESHQLEIHLDISLAMELSIEDVTSMDSRGWWKYLLIMLYTYLLFHKSYTTLLRVCLLPIEQMLGSLER
jgi:hypothetical protein